MSTALARDLANAQAKLAARAAEVAELEQKNAALRVRFAGLKLLVRGLTEIAEHRQMHGAAPGPLESLLDNLRAGMGAGGSTGAEPQEAASDPFFAELPHLAPGKQVLLLHEASEAEVAEVRAADAAAVKRLARGFHDAAARLSREIEAARAARDKAALARAQEEMRKEGVKFTRLSTLTNCWVLEVHSEAAATHNDTDELLQGLSDARLPHWQHVVSATQLTRPQALLINDMHECVQAHLQLVRAQRALLSSALAAATAAAAAAPDTTGAPAGAASQQAEQLAALEANLAAEAALIQAAASLTMIAVLTPSQLFRSFVASWPYPLSAPAVCEVLATKLHLEGPDAFFQEPPSD